MTTTDKSTANTNGDIATQVTYAMRAMGVAPIPRNYQLFYEIFIGSSPALSRDFAELGNKISQEDLDILGERHIAQPNAVEGFHGRITDELDNLLHLLKQEQTSLESYNRVLGETFRRIASKSNTSADILRSAINILTDATDRKKQQGETTANKLNRGSQELDQVRQELDEYKRIANTDSLTRLANRRAFDERLGALYANSSESRHRALILLDIDHFKRVNDNFGHPVGDKILATVASVLRANVRKDSFIARTGGEEFAVIIEDIGSDEVFALCERIRSSLENTQFKNSKSGYNYGPITISLGYCMASQAESGTDLYCRSDAALYRAKSDGRNRTCAYEDAAETEHTKNWMIYRR